MGDCLIPNTYRTRQGYSSIYHNGRSVLAHRVAYCEAAGVTLDSIKGLVVRHKCDNPPCCNPEHLLLGTQADNVRDRVERGRSADKRGIKNGRCKLSESQVLEIREKYSSGNFTIVNLGKEYGVSNQLISMIINFKAWTQLPGAGGWKEGSST